MTYYESTGMRFIVHSMESCDLLTCDFLILWFLQHLWERFWYFLRNFLASVIFVLEIQLDIVLLNLFSSSNFSSFSIFCFTLSGKFTWIFKKHLRFSFQLSYSFIYNSFFDLFLFLCFCGILVFCFSFLNVFYWSLLLKFISLCFLWFL